MTTAVGNNLIETRRSTAGRTAYVGATRVRVVDVVNLYRLHDEVMAEVCDALPHLTLPQISAALRYWQEHEAEIEEVIGREHALYKAAAS